MSHAPDPRDDEPLDCKGFGYFTGPICCGMTVNGECHIVCSIQERVPCEGCESCVPPSPDAEP